VASPTECGKLVNRSNETSREIHNLPTSTATFDLYGCQLADSRNVDVIDRHVTVDPGWFVTLARSTDVTLGFIPTYSYPTVKLANEGDTIELGCGGVVIDRVDFTTWGVAKGMSFSLDPRSYDAAANNLQANWCHGNIPYNTISADDAGETDYGTPGTDNPACH
jgi:hypothetical protein